VRDRRVDRLGAARAPAYRAAALAAYFLALAAKPIAVGLPFLFLLLDVWPLGRTRSRRPRPRAARARGTRELLPRSCRCSRSRALLRRDVRRAVERGAVRDLATIRSACASRPRWSPIPPIFASAVWPSGSLGLLLAPARLRRVEGRRRRGVPARGERGAFALRGARPRRSRLVLVPRLAGSR
jgi:hypothetical protein